jgi:hypothetical protein
MANEELAEENAYQAYVRALQPLFEPHQHLRSDRLFEYACCLIRAGGIEREDSDPILESAELLEDLRKLSTEHLDPKKFERPERTRTRLALLSYCHVTEADFFYQILASLAKLRAGDKYDIDPFFDLWRRRGPRTIPPVLSEKIRRVNELASRSSVDTASLFEQIYFKDIRNAVFHADYALTDTEFVMRHGLFKVKEGYLTPAVSFDELNSVIQRSFAFYSAVMQLHFWARRQLIELRNRILPFDSHYKGLLELLFEDDLLSGFRAYWPNGSNSEFIRSRSGCSAVNITFDSDRSINFMVGLYASKRGSFSPLVEHDAKATYTPAPGRKTAPYWPDDLKPYEAH